MIVFKGFVLNSFASGINLSDRNAQIFLLNREQNPDVKRKVRVWSL